MATSLRSARVLLQSKDAVRWRSKDAAATIFERNTDAAEDFYYYSGFQNARNGRRHLDLTVTARLRVDPQADIQPEHARAAWATLQQKNPALASFVHGSKRIYVTLDLEHTKKWLNKTFVVLPDEEEITPELLDSLPATDMPAMHFLPDSMTFALRTPQHLMDALGAVMLMNDFLAEMSRALLGDIDTQDDQPVELACSLKEAASLPSASISQRARLWNIRRRWLRSYPTVGVVPDQESPQSGLSSWHDLEYTPAETKEIIAKAKKHKMSVTHVIHAGVAFAAKEYGPFQLTRNYNTIILVDMRRRFTDEPARQRDALSPQHAMWPVSVQVTSFWKTAEILKNEYQELVKDPDLPALVEPVFAETIPGASSSCPTFHSAPIFGNCGRIDDRLESAYDGFAVDDFSISTECSGEEIVMAVWTYQGKLRIRAMFNEGYHSAKSIEQYMWRTEVALKDGLGVGKVHSWWP
ncbi:hypothetical protein ASPVEDRAFT_52841 [Aspergillus versicolor CBS 583.65]|uniref:Condensation domain-containing protein n=1 Tax=Aspergillus versicolor CBS 583.65 TaxID=1036611 RepID=A0A1L9PKK6_ASPVE|nr:uncharacterized protein ASPVEDRAFT_52841 [Aspergillus versicolor CBS 583.65]OJJ02068.1 hypothetical protein ASPVEDRAFT_52841 [Aspergillus versicolor CBS 583.65]